MGAVGGDTIIPTNWPGLIATVLIVAAIAAATYFGMDFKFGHAVEAETSDEVTLQEVFSANSTREIEAIETARASARAAPPAESFIIEPGPSEAPDAESADDSAQTQASDAQPAPEPAAQKPVAKAPPPAPNAAPAAAPKPAASSSSPAPPPAPASSSARPAAEPRPDTRTKPPADALSAWWADPNSGPEDFTVRYAGALDRGTSPSDAIALMFSEPVDPAAVGTSVSVRNEAGKEISGSWRAARNPNMVYLDKLGPGRYTLSIGKGLAARSGTRLPRDFRGPVYIY